MKALADGVWGTSRWLLDLIGRGTFRCLPANACPSDDEAYSMTGGAVAGALIGAVLGFTLSAERPDLSAVVGAILGSLTGICIGVGWGAIVECTDRFIRDALDSLSRATDQNEKATSERARSAPRSAIP